MALRILLIEFISEAMCQTYGMEFTPQTVESFTLGFGFNEMSGDELFALAQDYGFEA